MASSNPIVDRWRSLGRSRAGRALFSRLVGFMAPYSGSIRPRVQLLEPGRARVEMRDRRAIRNHLRSIHAAALMNLSELTGSLVALASLPDGARMIPTGLSIDFLKKARGRISAQASCEIPERADHGPLPVEVSLRDAAGDEVARATVTVLVGAASRKAG